MKKLSFSKKTNKFQYAVNIITIIALAIQCFPIPDIFQYIIAGVLIFIALLGLILDIIFDKKHNTLNRKNLVNVTVDLMRNSRGKVVMFGGDLSWSEDYLAAIKYLTDANQTVEVFFPYEKLHKNTKNSVKTRFEKNIKKLTDAGAIIRYTENDYHLRCTLIDIDASLDNDDFTVISSKRIKKDAKDENKNQYHVVVLKNSTPEDKMLCDAFYRNYLLIYEISKEYNDKYSKDQSNHSNNSYLDTVDETDKNYDI